MLLAALGLLDSTEGPVLVDYDEDVPASASAATDAPVCPVSFPTPREDDDLLARVLDELTALMPWYELGRERRGRTTVGLSGVDMAECARRLARFANTGVAPGDSSSATVDALRWASEDLKAFHVEAVTAQPGSADGEAVQRWFWRETACAELLRRVRRRALDSGDAALYDLGDFMLIGADRAD